MLTVLNPAVNGLSRCVSAGDIPPTAELARGAFLNLGHARMPLPETQTYALGVSAESLQPDHTDQVAAPAGVDLYWLPFGAGGHSVRLNGRVFESVVARLERRSPLSLYHSALEVRVGEGRFVIEMAPVALSGGDRGVVSEGAVGVGWAGRFRLFRYEIRRWRDGVIPDVAEAVESPRRLTDDLGLAERMFALVPTVPTLVWGRDAAHAGEMWNSNSLTSWLIARTGLPVESIHPPPGGRAPGWRSGVFVADRHGNVVDP